VRRAGGLVGRLPLGAGGRLGAALGEAAYWVVAGRRRVALDNLTLAFGDRLSEPARRALARRCFRHLGRTVVECCQLVFGTPADLLARIRIQGLEHLQAALAEGRGAFLLTAHFGNWELLAAAHVLVGIRLSVVARPLDNADLEAMVGGARARSGLRVIPKREAVRGVLGALGRGECVGILLDQDAGPQGAFVPFLGRPASTSRSLAVLALKTRAPVVPAFLHRCPDGTHDLVLEPPIAAEASGDLGADVVASTARFTAAIERHVRLHPEQWFWVHRRWKTRPR
jgi:KDO2-lipid IV(A) lauroyltransferase